jgi:hypothetical protein
MFAEPTHEEIAEDGDAPVTKADLRKVENNLRTEIEGVDQRLIGVEGRLAGVQGRLNHIEARLDGVENRLDRVEATMATKDQVANVLDVVQSIDQRLKEWGDVPGRLDQLEEDGAKLMLKR